MISVLSSPKPFAGTTAGNQVRAIQSWLAMAPDVEVTLYGDAPGVGEAAREMGLRWVPQVACSESGVPLFGAIVDEAACGARYDLQVYVNCDILLTSALLDAAHRLPFGHFLMSGRRLDLPEGCVLNPSLPGWQGQLRELAQQQRVSLLFAGMDYFVFRRGFWVGLPTLVVGRAGYDNALLAYAIRGGYPVVDATLCVPALHQFHDYSHVSGGRSEVYKGREAQGNVSACGGVVLTISDATWRLTRHRLVRGWGEGDFLRALEVFLQVRCGCRRGTTRLRMAGKRLQARGVSVRRVPTALDLVAEWSRGPV